MLPLPARTALHLGEADGPAVTAGPVAFPGPATAVQREETFSSASRGLHRRRASMKAQAGPGPALPVLEEP